MSVSVTCNARTRSLWASTVPVASAPTWAPRHLGQSMTRQTVTGSQHQAPWPDSLALEACTHHITCRVYLFRHTAAPWK